MSPIAQVAFLLLFPAAPADATLAQAFVPMLIPVERSEAHYPDAAVAQRLKGSVQLLVTIDPEGRPVNVEALNGPPILRQSAVEAIQQQKYRPVIRDGKPVYAMTSAIVDFRPPGPRTAEATDGFDIQEQVAAVRRLNELRALFPRTPAQIFADFEQDAGERVQQRPYFLPQLAKCAFDAGALDKARSYAGELLQLNDGQGTHDGNVVLGRLALRQGDVAQARQCLLSAGKTSGSPALNTFGPNMTLAKDLIAAGQRDAVLEYFDLCRNFWRMGSGKLDEWSAAVREGRMPNFGAHLVY